MDEAPILSSAPTAFHDLPKRALYLTVAGLMLSLLLAALDQTIVGTAMPRIIADLKGFEHYAWVTTAYLLTSTTVVPIVGKLSDMYGRKWFLVVGAAFFLAMSMLCGQAQTMTQLIVFRGLQGLGGGTLMATIFAAISEIFPPAQRARMQGLFSGVFGLASIVGPLAGGYLTDNLSWRWVFYVNLPVGALALAVLWLFFPNIRPHGRGRTIDYLGAATLVVAVVPLLLALSWGGQTYPWSSPQIIGLFVVAFVMSAIFFVVERRSPEPIIPLSLLKNRTVAVSTLALALMSIGMFGAVLFLPLFIQGVIGKSATESGTALTPMMIGMIASSIAVGQVISRTGRYKAFSIAGPLIGAFGTFLLVGMGPDTQYFTVIRNMVVIGLGLGLCMPVYTLVAQNAVPINRLGVVTSLSQFGRSIGGTLGVAIFGTVLTNGFSQSLQANLPAQLSTALPADRLAELNNPQAILNPEASQAIQQMFAGFGPQGAQLYAQFVDTVKLALVASIHDVFMVGMVMLVVSGVACVLLPELPLRKTNARPAGAPAAAPRSAPLAAAATESSQELLPPLQPEDQPVGAGAGRRG